MAYDITANYLAFRLSFETKISYPTSYLDKISVELKEFPGILFQKSRFINYRSNLSGHDKLFIEFLDKRGISRAPVVLSAFSSFSYAIISSAHIGAHFLPRRSAIGNYLGLIRTILKFSSHVHIIAAKRVLKEVKSSCLSCKKKGRNHSSKAPR